MKIVPCTSQSVPRWLDLRQAFWPDTSPTAHKREIADQLARPENWTQFLAEERGKAIGFVEASLRQDYVNGTETSPVAYLEGIFVLPAARRKGAGRALLDAVIGWARQHGVTELASDVPLDNLLSQRVHRKLDFEETERVVFFRRVIG